MKIRKKREADRRHRQNKKIAVQETENKLAMTITENESLKRAVEELRQEIFHLTRRQRELTEQKIAVQETENKLAMTIIENESLKRAVEELRQEIIHRTSQRELTEQKFETIYTKLEKLRNRMRLRSG
uniref:BZIP domain-containing protein n=1 Tax=Salix viminalis TaxID=40686 RepID=A0A6N2M7C3_SALVM